MSNLQLQSQLTIYPKSRPRATVSQYRILSALGSTRTRWRTTGPFRGTLRLSGWPLWACHLCSGTIFHTRKAPRLGLVLHYCCLQILNNFETRCLTFVFCFGSCKLCCWTWVAYQFDFNEPRMLSQQERALVHCWLWTCAPCPSRLG